MANEPQEAPQGELLLYQTRELEAPITVRLQGETLWLTQRQLAELYGTTVANINQHITTIYEEGEHQPEATIKKYLIVQTEGTRQVRRLVDHYSLDMILAIGFRVRSRRGSQFRQWANERLSEYLVKGFTMDDTRLKGQASAVDYFDELLARIRDIRASEARVYLMLRNIFALAVDYVKDDARTQHFFATLQNKMHYAATGLTAAEIIQQRANAAQPNMGLTSWKGARVSKADTGIAKNYLGSSEIEMLNRMTVMFLDQAEFRAQRRQAIHIAEWGGFLDKFLADMELPILKTAGKVSHQQALQTAHQQYDRFAEKRRLEAEQQAEQNYLNELQATAQTLAQQRKIGQGAKTSSPRPRRARSARAGGEGTE